MGLLDKYTNTGECQMNCDRNIIKTKTDIVVVCDYCKRIVMNVNKKI